MTEPQGDDVGHEERADATRAREAAEAEHARRRLFLNLGRGDDDEGLGERLTQQFAQQWAALRAERRAEPLPAIRSGPSNFSRAQVPWGVDLAAAWSWRLIVIAVASLAVLWLLREFSLVTVPLAVALLLAALGNPLVGAMHRAGIPRGLSSFLVMLLGIGGVGLMLYFVGQQVVNGAFQLADQVVAGLGEIREWIREGPLAVSDSQLDAWIKDAQRSISEAAEPAGVLNSITDVGVAIGNGVAGFFIVVFAFYFFLADGDRIWSWVVRLAPRAGRERIDSSGRVAWVSLTQYVRATVIVALVDALGIALVAKILGLPLVAAIGVLVFLGSFVPMVGATVAGTVAVLVALVDQGPITALLMLGGVLLVQQIEGNVLQPFLMGRFVSVHPLGVLLAIAIGIMVAGLAGALIAVPIVASLNAVVQHLSDHDEPPEDGVPAPPGAALGGVAEASASEPSPAATEPSAPPAPEPPPSEPGTPQGDDDE
ncbi:MAG: AI-2E family transporter [Nocardioides sp.]|uniref:AI-2E family transporter n=1 Tax=Nocardioides sp. TaxID=35761 RepID=UPI003F005AB0